MQPSEKVDYLQLDDVLALRLGEDLGLEQDATACAWLQDVVSQVVTQGLVETQRSVDLDERPLAMSAQDRLDSRVPKRRTPNHWTSSRRHELCSLREQVTKLEHHLTALDVRANENRRRMENGQMRVVDQQEVKRIELWRQVAARQFQYRLQSENENFKLKKLLRDQIRVGTALKRLSNQFQSIPRVRTAAVAAPVPVLMLWVFDIGYWILGSGVPSIKWDTNVASP
jgi:hypothetical protein